MNITHIFHDGFLVELEHTLLLFDYYQGSLPELNPKKPLFVFVSHRHYDHYTPAIWELCNQHPCVRYVVYHDVTDQCNDSILPVEYHQTYHWNGISIETLRSTDEGCAFIVTAEGKTFYHAGDLNWWHWEGEPQADNDWHNQAFHDELLRIKGRTFDCAFLPLDPRQQDNAWWGFVDFLKNCACRHVFPMHYFNSKSEMLAYLNLSELAPFLANIHTESQWQS